MVKLFLTYHIKMTGGGVRHSRLSCFALHHGLPLLSLGGRAAVRPTLGFCVTHLAALLVVHLVLGVVGKRFLATSHLLFVTES